MLEFCLSGLLETEVRDGFMETGALLFRSEFVSVAFLWTNSRTYRHNVSKIACEVFPRKNKRICGND